MDIKEAKALLATHRAGETDVNDPALAEALRLAESEAELAAWLENENAFDEAFSSRLHEIEPPADLKAKLLALDPEGSATSGDGEKVITLNDRRWWQRSSVLSVAATIVILLAFGMMMLDPSELDASTELPEYFDEVGDHYSSGAKLASALTDMEEIRAELAAKEYPIPGVLPEKIDDLLEVGYGEFEYEGYPVSFIRMSDGNLYQLYLINRSCFEHEDQITDPRVFASNELALMAWMDDNHLYVLILEGTVEHLEGLL